MLRHKVLVLWLLSMLPLFGWQAGGKVAVVNVQAVIANTKEGRKVIGGFSARVEQKKQSFEARQKEITLLAAKVEQGGAVLAAKRSAEMTREVEEKRKKLSRDTQDAEEELQAEQQKLLQPLGQKVLAVVEKYAAANGFGLVLDVSSPATPVLYASAATNITEEVIRVYDRTYPEAPAAK